jgi:hypothetical protein
MDSFSLFSKNQLVRIPAEFAAEFMKLPRAEEEKIIFIASGITEREKNFALKIAAAIGYSGSDCKFLGLTEGTYLKVTDDAVSSYELILFAGPGSEQSDIGLSAADYELTYKGGTAVVFAGEFSEIAERKELKMKLWSALKKLSE